jgi:signal transduction histidine kinase
MIIAGRHRDRIDLTSAVIAPVAPRSRRTAPAPNPVTAPAPGARARRAPTPLGRLRHAIARRPLPAPLPWRSIAAATAVISLAALASALAPWARLEPHATDSQAAVATTVKLLCALAAVLFFDRFWRRPQARSLVFAGALAIAAASVWAAGALLVCACVEWSLEERRAAARILPRERRRMAADVHDLIMQDLALALANARTLTDDPAHAARATTVVAAGERALASARDIVSGLSEHDTRPIAQAVEASVRAAARHTPLEFDAARVPSSARLDRPTRDALVHIAREAVTNAVKHARPNAVEVVLEHAGQWRLTVRDDGRGFDEAPADAGFGLSSMRQSAHALGGAVRVGRSSGGGTTVEAILP